MEAPIVAVPVEEEVKPATEEFASVEEKEATIVADPIIDVPVVAEEVKEASENIPEENLAANADLEVRHFHAV